MTVRVQRRWLMPVAWVTLLVLSSSLALREGLALWHEQTQWRGLAESAAGMQPGAALTAEYLQRSAVARQIALVEVLPGDTGWQLRGRLTDERLLNDWLQALHLDGARPLQWGLERTEAGFDFDLVLAR